MAHGRRAPRWTGDGTRARCRLGASHEQAATHLAWPISRPGNAAHLTPPLLTAPSCPTRAADPLDTHTQIQKQVLIGDAACGKSSLLVRLTDNRFLTNSEPTIGVEFGSRIVEINEGDDRGKRIKLQIWDTAGQESFRAITRSYYRGAGGALLVFSLTSHASFAHCAGWLADLRAWGEDDLLVLLVGNKGDVLAAADEGGEAAGGERREVERDEAEKWARDEGLAGYVETSAKSGAGVEEAFNTLTRLVHARSQASLAANRARKTGSAGSALPSITLAGATSAVGGKCC
ncbi:ras family-domain-containing protein [Rhodotorula diobovata]|uniref:Ras family-domain-containing protein n=1 Tax=Rhodotorula diobovata TaxID=5288 RepID=A0A5C5G6Z5_9BASI|nr:ras family-domain-containing protein [Rhodotorula diobovata]